MANVGNIKLTFNAKEFEDMQKSIKDLGKSAVSAAGELMNMGTQITKKGPVKDWSAAKLITVVQDFVKLGHVLSAKGLAEEWLAHNHDWELVEVKLANSPFGAFYLYNKKLGIQVGHKEVKDSEPGDLYMGGKFIGNVQDSKEPLPGGKAIKHTVSMTVQIPDSFKGKKYAVFSDTPFQDKEGVQLAAKVEQPPPGWLGAGKASAAPIDPALQQSFDALDKHKEEGLKTQLPSKKQWEAQQAMTADAAVSTKAGMLTPEQAEEFVKILTESPTINKLKKQWEEPLFNLNKKFIPPKHIHPQSVAAKLSKTLFIDKDVKTMTVWFVLEHSSGMDPWMKVPYWKLEDLGLPTDAEKLMHKVATVIAMQGLDPSDPAHVKEAVHQMLGVVK